MQNFNGGRFYIDSILFSLSFPRITSESDLEWDDKLRNEGKFSSATVSGTDTKLNN